MLGGRNGNQFQRLETRIGVAHAPLPMQCLFFVKRYHKEESGIFFKYEDPLTKGRP